jgi:D-alanyl-D-alanine carboxypeptidase
MYVALHSKVKVRDLIQGVIVQSGNDACIVLAEGIATTELAFAEMMNKRAREIGLTKSNFTNSTGLHDPDLKVTARELAKLAQHLIQTYPEFYKIYGEREFTWNKIRQQNRNPLLAMNVGADGLKTGFTSEAGYGLVGSAVQNGLRLIVVVNGLKTAKERAEEGRKLLEWGFKGGRPRAAHRGQGGEAVGAEERRRKDHRAHRLYGAGSGPRREGPGDRQTENQPGRERRAGSAVAGRRERRTRQHGATRVRCRERADGQPVQGRRRAIVTPADG